MIIKSIELKNIRSYVDETINFPLGITLFKGDVASGKSTILMAIEFALFGLGSEDGNGLLRFGENNGSVKLRFEVDGEEYEVFRSLKRKTDRARQGEGYIVTKEGKFNLSAGELKEKMLEILGFNEPPNPNAKSVIYRYVVYTPQEEMKVILFMDPDERVQTLRKAFRIEDYKIALENASKLLQTIRERKIKLESRSHDLEEKLRQKESEEKSLRDKQIELSNRQMEKRTVESKLEKIKKEIDEASKEKGELDKVETTIMYLKQDIAKKDKEIEEIRHEIKKIEKKISEKLKPPIDRYRSMKEPTEKTREEIGRELEELTKQIEILQEKKGAVEAKIEDYRLIEENKICPTCDRPADPEEYKEKLNQKEDEKKKTLDVLEKCKKKKNLAEKLLKECNEYEQAQEELQKLEEQLKENENIIKEKSGKIKELSEGKEELNKKMEEAKKKIKKMEAVSIRLNELEKEKEKIEEKQRKLVEATASLETTIRTIEGKLKELSEEIERKKRDQVLAENLGSYHIWLKDFLEPALENIEKHVLASINEEFNEHFQRWFSLLVEDPRKDVRIDEDFTPIMEQDGYKQALEWVSGGERTSIALSYRLALNTIVRKLATNMKSNLLILDEPTDGFSKEQLFKLRDILSEIGCPQIVIVSHEEELESFVDHIYGVENTGGVSKVKSS